MCPISPSGIAQDMAKHFFPLGYCRLFFFPCRLFLSAMNKHVPYLAISKQFGFLPYQKSRMNEAYQALSTVIQNCLTDQSSDLKVLAGPNATSYPLLAVGLMGISVHLTHVYRCCL